MGRSHHEADRFVEAKVEVDSDHPVLTEEGDGDRLWPALRGEHS